MLIATLEFMKKENKMIPSVLIYQKGDFKKIDGLNLWRMSLVAEVDGDTTILIKNRLDSRKEIPTDRLFEYISNLFDFYR